MLLKNHASSLRTLEFRRYTRNWKSTNLEALASVNLTSLKISTLDTNGGSWPLRLLAKNYKSLRHLELSNETGAAHEYTVDGALDPDGTGRESNTQALIKLIKIQVDALEEAPVPLLQLDSLSMCDFDLTVIWTTSSPLIDFSKLSTLVIKSCSGLNTALPLLGRANVTQGNAVGALRLRTLILRHENSDDTFLTRLMFFLSTLGPLTTLHVLLEGQSDLDILVDSLKPHGKSLESLIWDQRSQPRTQIQVDPTLTGLTNLKVIAKQCTRLKALGIPLPWQQLTNSEYAMVS